MLHLQITKLLTSHLLTTSKEIKLAEAEMPALIGLRKRYAASKPLAGAKFLVVST